MVETMINLTHMMEAIGEKAKGGKGVDTAFDDFHNQLHALAGLLYGDVTKEQAKSPAYDLAVTHKKELTAIFCGYGNLRTFNDSAINTWISPSPS